MRNQGTQPEKSHGSIQNHCTFVKELYSSVLHEYKENKLAFVRAGGKEVVVTVKQVP